MRRTTRTAPLIGAMVVTVALVSGTGGCDTRHPADVTGTVIGKTEKASGDSHNPSLVVDTNGLRTPGGEVRVWLKREFWETYNPGDAYP